jgi:hypothetical protein
MWIAIFSSWTLGRRLGRCGKRIDEDAMFERAVNSSEILRGR